MLLCFRHESKTCMKKENKKEPNFCFPDNLRPWKGATLAPLKDTNRRDASPRPWENEQREPDPTLRPRQDKQRPSPAVVRPLTAASQLQKQFSLGHRWGFHSSHGCHVLNRIHIKSDMESFRSSSQSPEWQLFFFKLCLIVFFFSIKSLTVGKLYPPTKLPSLPYLPPVVSVARPFYFTKANKQKRLKL